MDLIVILLVMFGVLSFGCLLCKVLPGTDLDAWLIRFTGGEEE